jgi:hypothetical protein
MGNARESMAMAMAMAAVEIPVFLRPVFWLNPLWAIRTKPKQRRKEGRRGGGRR